MTPLVVVTPTELANLVRAAVADVLDAGGGGEREQLWTRDEAAAYLRVTPRQVDLLRKRGLPTRWVASSPRFDRAELDEWTSSGGGSQRTKPRSGRKDAGSDVEAAGRVTEGTGTASASRDSAHLGAGPVGAPNRPSEPPGAEGRGEPVRGGKGPSARRQRARACQSVGAMDGTPSMGEGR